MKIATKVLNVKINADIASFKTKMQDARKSIQDMSESIKKATGNSKLSDALGASDFGKKLEEVKTKASNLGQVFKALPGPAKALVVVTAVLTVTKKLYDAGKQRFFDGLNNIKDTVSPVFQGMLTSINAVKDAFSELTGFDFNLSSLITTGANFESQMKTVATIAGSVGTEFDQLVAKARELGAATTFSASQVGQAMQYMAMAGWSTQEMLDGVQSTLNLAKIGATDLGTASDILTDDLTALGMQANQAGDFADKLAATITRSNTDVVLFGESMKQTGAIAGALGASMTDLSTSIGLMANAGIKGSKAGMSLKNMLSNMANPTDQQDRALQELGLTADKTGSYLKTTADGCTDLEATVKALREGTENMTRSQKAALIATVAGKNALPGVMSLVNASAEEYNKLSEAIDNSTSTVSMFNENMNILGLKGEDATKRIEVMKDVFSNTETSATALGLSSKDLGYAISLLGDDCKVSSQSVEDLLDVVESMDNASGKVDKFWRSVGNAKNIEIDGKAINQLIDYNGTLSAVDNSIVGLSDHTVEYAKAHNENYKNTKEYVKSLVKEGMTIDDANSKLSKYGIEAEKISLSTLSMSQKTDYLRQAFKGMSDEQIKAKLQTIGLGDSFDEVNEIVDMSDEKYATYKKNLKEIEGLSTRLAESMDKTTKSTFQALSSAIEDSLIGAFEKMKPALINGSQALTDFFSTWRNGDKNTYTFDGFEKGLADLETKVSNAAKNIPNLISNAISGANRFISGSSLDSLLSMGSSMVKNIAQGIINNKEGLSTAISSLISKVCSWIQENGPMIQQAGKVILEAIGNGIRNNRDQINSACGIIYDAMNDWSAANAENMGILGGSVADKFIWGFLKGFTMDKFAGIKGFFAGLFNSDGQDAYQQWGISSGQNYTNGINSGLEQSKSTTNATATEIGDGISQNIMNKLETMNASQLKELEKELKSLQTTTQNVANGIGSSFGKIRNTVRENLVGSVNIGRNQFVNLANIIRNQSQNARNSATRSFISLRKVINTQITQARTAVTSKMISIANVVRTQSQNARNNATRSFISLRKVIQTQMSQAYSSVNSYMSKIASATNRTLNTKVNVTRTVNTVNQSARTANLKAVNTMAYSNLAYSAIRATNNAATASLASTSTSSFSSSTGVSSSSNSTAKATTRDMRIVMPVYLDSKVIGESTADIVDDKIKVKARRENRKRGR